MNRAKVEKLLISNMVFVRIVFLSIHTTLSEQLIWSYHLVGYRTQIVLGYDIINILLFKYHSLELLWKKSANKYRRIMKTSIRFKSKSMFSKVAKQLYCGFNTSFSVIIVCWLSLETVLFESTFKYDYKINTITIIKSINKDQQRFERYIMVTLDILLQYRTSNCFMSTLVLECF